MSDDPTQTLDLLDARYRVRFAGHSRTGRNPDELTQMLAELDGIAEAAKAGGLADRWQQAHDLYVQEREAIRTARSVPGAVQAHRLRVWADLAMGRYKHGFAGQDRRTRDVTRLDDIRRFLQDLRGRLTTMHETAPHLELAPVIAAVERSLEMYATETRRIRETRTEGTFPERGTRLANLANDQFEAYRQGFAGQSRISRHLPRLERIIGALDEIGAAMEALRRDGYNDATNAKNLALVVERTTAYRKELKAVTEAREGADLPDRVNALGAAANQVFGWYREEFAGKDRTTRDPGRIDVLFELLWPIAIEMDTIDRDEDHEINERNLSLVLDNLLLYTREWDAIRAARSDA